MELQQMVGLRAIHPNKRLSNIILKQATNVGDVRVEITDAAGKIDSIHAGNKRKGLNVVYWNMRSTLRK